MIRTSQLGSQESQDVSRRAIALRSDFDAARLRVLAAHTPDADYRRRLLALAQLYEGVSRSACARTAGTTLQILRDWVVRFNVEGPDGLTRQRFKGPGSLGYKRVPRLTSSMAGVSSEPADAAELSPGELKQARAALGLSQVEFANRLDISRGNVERWERGVARPPPFLRLAIAAIAANLNPWHG